MASLVVAVGVLSFLHYTAAQMRGPVLTLYAAANGATATGVGYILGAHMLAAAVGSMPLGRFSDVGGCRRVMLAGMTVGAVTSLLLPLVQSELALTVIYGLAGLGVAAFTPSALSLIGAAAPAGRAGHAFAWYATAHYAAIGVGPFVGGLVAERWGYRAAFVASGVGIALAVLIGRASLAAGVPIGRRQSGAAFADIKRHPGVWAGWIVSVAGLLVQGVVFAFFPLLAHERGLGPAAIGLVLLVLGLANTAARLPAGWLIDRSGRPQVYAVAGVVAASLVAALLPNAQGQAMVLALAAVFGATSGIAFVGVSVALSAAAPPAARGLVMGGYSTALYLGLALGSIACGPIITRHGHAAGFTTGSVFGLLGTLVAAALWARAGTARTRRSPTAEPA